MERLPKDQQGQMRAAIRAAWKINAKEGMAGLARRGRSTQTNVRAEKRKEINLLERVSQQLPFVATCSDK
jgi:hypothetical protein